MWGWWVLVGERKKRRKQGEEGRRRGRGYGGLDGDGVVQIGVAAVAGGEGRWERAKKR